MNQTKNVHVLFFLSSTILILLDKQTQNFCKADMQYAFTMVKSLVMLWML